MPPHLPSFRDDSVRMSAPSVPTIVSGEYFAEVPVLEQRIDAEECAELERGRKWKAECERLKAERFQLRSDLEKVRQQLAAQREVSSEANAHEQMLPPPANAASAVGTVDTAASKGTEPVAEVPAPDDRWSASQWLTSIGVVKAVASILLQVAPGGTSMDELTRIRKLGSSCTSASLASYLLERNVAQMIAETIIQPMRLLSESEWASAQELISNPKYAETETTAGFADTSAYFGGLERILGAPNPRLRRGMEADHTEFGDSHVEFEAPNYGVRDHANTHTAEVTHTKPAA